MRIFGLVAIAIVAAFQGTDAQAQSCPTRHVIVQGDTLSLLARRFYGDPRAFRLIYDANRATIGDNPSLVEIGMVLTIPCPPGTAAAAAPEPTPVPEAPAETQEQAETPTEPQETPPAARGVVPGWQVLIEPQQLAELVRSNAVQILDIRTTEETLSQGLVPRSISVPFALWYGDEGAPVPSDVTLSILVGENGLGLDRPIIIVPADGSPERLGEAAWVYWLLRSLGARQVALLEPGFEGWLATGQRASRRALRPRARQLLLSMAGDWRAGPEDLIAIRDRRGNGALFRPDPEAFLSFEDPTSDRASAILERLKGYPVGWEAELVISVNEDPRIAALIWFYASEVAGIRNVSLYPAPLGTAPAPVIQ